MCCLESIFHVIYCIVFYLFYDFVHVIMIFSLTSWTEHRTRYHLLHSVPLELRTHIPRDVQPPRLSYVDWVCSIFNICCTMSYVMLPCRTYVHWRARSIVAKRLCIVLSNLILSNPIQSYLLHSYPILTRTLTQDPCLVLVEQAPHRTVMQHCTVRTALHHIVLCYVIPHWTERCCAV